MSKTTKSCKKFVTGKNQIIQREQLQLVKIQRELEAILGKVNESINALKVEELQLKSSAVEAMDIARPVDGVELRISCEQPSSSAKALPGLVGENTLPDDKQFKKEAEVNQQELDLDMFVRPKALAGGGTMEEEEEDEEDE